MPAIDSWMSQSTIRVRGGALASVVVMDRTVDPRQLPVQSIFPSTLIVTTDEFHRASPPALLPGGGRRAALHPRGSRARPGSAEPERTDPAAGGPGRNAALSEDQAPRRADRGGARLRH